VLIQDEKTFAGKRFSFMRILVTGNNGYLGSLLVPQLIQKGWDVVGLDTGFYDQFSLYHRNGVAPATWVEDLRRCEAKHFEGIDAVVHMAELSNDRSDNWRRS
jgi:nucleoside-diphosphate-sugar epimerase